MEVYIRKQERILRIPLTLAEPGLISEPSPNTSLWALIRFALLSRMRLIVKNSLDTILEDKELLQGS